jgi:signal transduction histidine kinase
MVRRFRFFQTGGLPVLFAFVAAPVFLLVGYLFVHAEQDSATETLIRATEAQNANVAHTIANAHLDPIFYLLAFNIGDAPDLLPVALQRADLGPRIESSVKGTDVVNVKLYDGNGITLFSRNEADLGVNVSACACFANVLENGRSSELVLIDGPQHVHEPHGGNVLSTMVRLNVLTPDLVAPDSVLEIQTDVTALLAEITATRTKTALRIGIPLALLYLAMVAIVMFGHAAIRRRDRRAADLAARAATSEASDRAKSEFLSLMSHELRTPLNAIIGFSQLIRDGCGKDEDTATYANTIEDSGQHMLRLITTILDMTALELGDLELEREVVRLDDVVCAAIANVRSQFDKCLVALDVFDSEPPAPILGDRARLQQVFENLLSNAARYAAAGGTVEVSIGYDAGKNVSVSIADSGAGMTREQIDRARLPFSANWVGYARAGEGLGLGLTIADKIVSRLGGELDIESDVGVGTRITVSLPVLAADRSNVTDLDSARRGRVHADADDGQAAAVWDSPADCRDIPAVIASAPSPDPDPTEFHGARYRYCTSHRPARPHPRG